MINPDKVFGTGVGVGGGGTGIGWGGWLGETGADYYGVAPIIWIFKSY